MNDHQPRLRIFPHTILPEPDAGGPQQQKFFARVREYFADGYLECGATIPTEQDDVEDFYEDLNALLDAPEAPYTTVFEQH